VQLCGEALCLEEMFGVPVTAGALFYGRRRRRLNVSFDSALRKETEQAAARLHELIASRRTPVARREAKCESCSLLDLCLPGAVGSGHGAQHYVDRALARSLASVDGPAEDL
jgi:CRISPR-associated exonuclease Cas4